MTTTRYALADVSEVSRYGRRVVRWADITAPDTEIIIQLDNLHPIFEHRRRAGQNLQRAARAWGQEHGYRVTSASPRDWSEVAITFEEATS
jgi:hypothetical protein